MYVFPTFKPGNYGQASTSAKSAEKLKTPGERRVPREYTHTQSVGVHEDIEDSKKGRRVESPDIVRYSSPTGCSLSK